MKVSYYPGCSLESTGKGYDHSTREVCGALGVELQEVPDWVCCGSSAGLKMNRLLSTALSGANLAILEKQEPSDVVAPCPFCYRRLASAQDFQKSYELPAGGQILIGNFLGNITVTGYAGSTVEVKAYMRGPDRHAIRINDLSFGNRVELAPFYPGPSASSAAPPNKP